LRFACVNLCATRLERKKWQRIVGYAIKKAEGKSSFLPKSVEHNTLYFSLMIFLVGYMGSGKSTTGRLLAEEKGWSFFDLDEEIEEKTGRSIPEIFKSEGETVFRQIEHDSLWELVALYSKGVVATGGGTACFHDNMEVMKKHGKVIFIDVPETLLFDRLKSKIFTRPVLAQMDDKQLMEFIAKHLRERRPFYQQADYTVRGDQPDEFLMLELKEVIEQWSL
jgi:shikimate kinase